MKILVTGASGQLGKCLQKIVQKNKSKDNYIFKSSKDLDISRGIMVSKEFAETDYDYCINCAAYTHVDKAEDEVEKAIKINVDGVENLAKACSTYAVVFIHISTDFVFDGEKESPYLESDNVNPTGVYGETKLFGEQKIVESLEEHFILRTSWLYSKFGHNFMKTMLRLAKEKKELSVVNDQIGSPTYAMDLAEVIFKIIKLKSAAYGLYHYSNEGEASWYDFAKAIFEISNSKINLKPISSYKYPTKAKRPKYSVLNKSKIKNELKIEISPWKERLANALDSYLKMIV